MPGHRAADSWFPCQSIVVFPVFTRPYRTLSCLTEHASSTALRHNNNLTNLEMSEVRPQLSVLFCLLSASVSGATFGPTAIEISHAYTGLYQCGTSIVEVGLTLTAEASGSLTGRLSAVQAGSSRKTSAERNEPVSLKGTYNPSTGGFALAADDTVLNRRFEIDGLLQRNGRFLVAAHRGPAGRQCSPIVAVAGDALPETYEAVRVESERGDLIRSNQTREGLIAYATAAKKMQSGGICEPALANWIASLETSETGVRQLDPRASARRLLQTTHFSQFFGAALHELDTERRINLFLQATGPCRRDIELNSEQKTALSFSSAAFVNTGHFNAADPMLADLARTQLADWRRAALQHMDEQAIGPDKDQLLDAFLADAAMVASLSTVSQQKVFADSMEVHRTPMPVESLEPDTGLSGTVTTAPTPVVDKAAREASVEFSNMEDNQTEAQTDDAVLTWSNVFDDEDEE